MVALLDVSARFSELGVCRKGKASIPLGLHQGLHTMMPRKRFKGEITQNSISILFETHFPGNGCGGVKSEAKAKCLDKPYFYVWL